MARSEHGLAAGERVRQGTAINVFQLTANRHTVRDPARTDAALGGQLSEEVGGRLSFHRRIGRENQLPDRTLVQNCFELPDAQLLGSDSIERRQVAHENEVPAAVAARLFDRDNVRGRLNDTQQGGITMGRGTSRANRLFRKHATAAAAHDRLQRHIQRTRQRTRP